jgi:hypothetical protein
MKIISTKGLAPLIAIIIVALVIGTGIIVYQSLKTRNEAITALTSTTSITLPAPSITLPTPPNNWVSFSDTKLGLEFKVPIDVKVKIYEPPIHSYSDYYSEINGMIKSGITFETGITAKARAEYYYNLYQIGGTTLKIFYNNTGGKSDKFQNKLLVILNNPSQLPFNQWKNTFEYCNEYNPAVSIFESDACGTIECICNYDGIQKNNIPRKYEIFEQIPRENNLTVYLGNNGYNFAAFLPVQNKVYLVSKTYQTSVKPPSLSIEEAKNDFLNSRELKILSSLEPISK